MLFISSYNNHLLYLKCRAHVSMIKQAFLHFYIAITAHTLKLVQQYNNMHINRGYFCIWNHNYILILSLKIRVMGYIIIIIASCL